jgi:hypothetical protein
MSANMKRIVSGTRSTIGLKYYILFACVSGPVLKRFLSLLLAEQTVLTRNTVPLALQLSCIAALVRHWQGKATRQ